MRVIKKKVYKRYKTGKKRGGQRYSSSVAIPDIPDLSKSESKEVVDNFVDNIVKTLKRNNKAQVKDLGIFKVQKIPAKPRRKGRNPFTGKEMMFKAKPASKKIKFRPSKSMKEAM